MRAATRAHVSTALPITGVEGAAISRGRHRPGEEGGAARFDRLPESARHRHGIAGLRDGGVEQHAVVAELHRRSRMRRQADAGVDDQRNLGEMGAQRPQAEQIVEPLAGADRRAPGHQHFAPRFDQPLGDDEILGRVREDFETLAGKDPRRLDEAEHVRL